MVVTKSFPEGVARQLSPWLEGGELESRLRVDLTHLHAGGAGVLSPCFQGTSFHSVNTQGERTAHSGQAVVVGVWLSLDAGHGAN